jgi:phosphotransferase system  glucose/maltose/N-acetylglucosamine-specific IIC component
MTALWIALGIYIAVTLAIWWVGFTEDFAAAISCVVGVTWPLICVCALVAIVLIAVWVLLATLVGWLLMFIRWADERLCGPAR